MNVTAAREPNDPKGWRIGRPSMTGALTRKGRSVLYCVALMGVAAPARACLPVNPAEYAVELAACFWLVALLLGGLILCLDLYEQRLSFPLPVAGRLVFCLGIDSLSSSSLAGWPAWLCP